MNKIKNQRGFLLLNVVFLTLITSVAAMILINAAPRIRNPQSTLRLTALYLANEQFAQLESLAANGEALPKNFLGKKDDLTTENSGAEINFEVTVPSINEVTVPSINEVTVPSINEVTVPSIKSDGNLREVTVKVSWTVNGKDYDIKSKRTLWVVPKETSTETENQ